MTQFLIMFETDADGLAILFSNMGDRFSNLRIETVTETAVKPSRTVLRRKGETVSDIIRAILANGPTARPRIDELVTSKGYAKHTSGASLSKAKSDGLVRELSGSSDITKQVWELVA